jgi:hypothetical protein
MKITKSIGMILLAAFLIITGLVPLLGLTVGGLDTILAILAIAAGVFILLGR